MTLEAVLCALTSRLTKRRSKHKKEQKKRRASAYKKPHADIKHLVDLAFEPQILSSRLFKLRKIRRNARRHKARLAGAAECTGALMFLTGPTLPNNYVNDDE